MKVSQFSRHFNYIAGLILIVSSVGCGSLPWRNKPAPMDTSYQDYVEQSVANIDYKAPPTGLEPPVRLSSSSRVSPADLAPASPSDESCQDACCH
ncbi:hypothetical protein [Novipirellula rosea]|uniref:Secreted protein n=1 Tax=Novipirellula rosea TaxID=1031540 RepID=A0ABP8NMC9_9BACT